MQGRGYCIAIEIMKLPATNFVKYIAYIYKRKIFNGKALGY